MDTKAAFEKWIKSDLNLEITMRCDMTKGIAWAAWQASRAAIEIDLDHLCYIQVEEGTFYLDEGSVEAVITSHGIKVKS